MTNEWEPFDEELAGALRRRAGSASHDPLATDAAHRHVLARAATVRRRRASAAGGGALAVLLVGGLVLLNGGGAGDDQVASDPDTTLPGTTLPSTVTSPATYPPDTMPTTTPAPSTTVGTTNVTVPSTGPGSTEPTPTDPTNTTPEVTSTTVPTTPTGTPAGEYRYPSTGGAITVNWDGTEMTLGLIEPSSGYTYEIEDERSDRIRVRFRGDDDSRIECRLENGRLVVEIT